MGAIITKKHYNELLNIIKKYDSLAVAFSAGVDSTLLLKAAKDALGENALAITVMSDFVPMKEIESAKAIAKDLNVRHILLSVSPLDFPTIANNPTDRCYHCKIEIFKNIKKCAVENGIKFVAEGSNLDDTEDYRPGMKAIKELEIVSPLLEAKLTKKEIREISESLDLDTWNKPALACLASRVPYGEIITKEKLKKIEAAEDILNRLGFKGARLRLHGNLARIEILPEDFSKFFAVRIEIVKKLKELGFSYITLDIEGYRRGSLNEVTN